MQRERESGGRSLLVCWCPIAFVVVAALPMMVVRHVSSRCHVEQGRACESPAALRGESGATPAGPRRRWKPRQGTQHPHRCAADVTRTRWLPVPFPFPFRRGGGDENTRRGGWGGMGDQIFASLQTAESSMKRSAVTPRGHRHRHRSRLNKHVLPLSLLVQERSVPRRLFFFSEHSLPRHPRPCCRAGLGGRGAGIADAGNPRHA